MYLVEHEVMEAKELAQNAFGPHQEAFLERLEKHIREIIGDPFWVKFKRIHELAKVPTRAYDSAGYDLFPCEIGTIMPGETRRIELGITSSFSPGYAGVIDDRSSTGLRNITHLAGVIDWSFTGKWALLLHNLDAENAAPFEFSQEKAIAQVLFIKTGQAEPIELGEDECHDESERGERGFGSSDK